MTASTSCDNKICIFGAGAIGGYLAAQLWHAGIDVCVVARGPHLEAIRRNGLRLIAAGRETIAPIRASDRASEFGPQDFLICALKRTKLMKALRP